MPLYILRLDMNRVLGNWTDEGIVSRTLMMSYLNPNEPMHYIFFERRLSEPKLSRLYRKGFILEEAEEPRERT